MVININISRCVKGHIDQKSQLHRMTSGDIVFLNELPTPQAEKNLSKK